MSRSFKTQTASHSLHLFAFSLDSSVARVLSFDAVCLGCQTQSPPNPEPSMQRFLLSVEIPMKILKPVTASLYLYLKCLNRLLRMESLRLLVCLRVNAAVAGTKEICCADCNENISKEVQKITIQLH